MDKLQCPRCGNEEIKDANYCKICGLKLKEALEFLAQEQQDNLYILNAYYSKMYKLNILYKLLHGAELIFIFILVIYNIFLS